MFDAGGCMIKLCTLMNPLVKVVHLRLRHKEKIENFLQVRNASPSLRSLIRFKIGCIEMVKMPMPQSFKSF